MSPPPNGLIQKIIQQLGRDQRVLSIGHDADLARVFHAKNPKGLWREYLEFNPLGIEEIEFDWVIFNGTLGQCLDPSVILSNLRKRFSSGTKLLVVLENQAHYTVLQRLLIGDCAFSQMRGFTASSFCRLALDTGWLPNLSQWVGFRPRDTALLESLSQLAESCGIPAVAARRNALVSHFIFECTPNSVCESKGPFRESLSVIVPTNNPLQYQLNIEASLGLREISAELIPIHGASSAADAFSKGAAQATGSWLLFCHQDVYLPKNSGKALLSFLQRVPADLAPNLLLGFGGLGFNPLGPPLPAGLLIDRLSLFDHPSSNRAVSLDEFAMVFHQDTIHRIDGDLGWHLWGTGLCLAAEKIGKQATVGITRLPIFHNSLSDNNLPEVFSRSAALLKKKYPHNPTIHSLCGEIT
jgi:hypothetical protein